MIESSRLRSETREDEGSIGRSRLKRLFETASRFLLGGLLVAAAVAKAMDGEGLADGYGFHVPAWCALLIVGAEGGLGVWLIVGVHKRAAWHWAMLSFLVFSLVSANNVLDGKETCHCFGDVDTSPWLSLCIDIVAIAILLVWYRLFGGDAESKRWYWARLCAPACGFMIVSALGAGTTYSYGPAGSTQTPRTIAAASSVKLVPEQWSGSELPIMDWIDVRDSIRAGQWLILLYYPDCDVCRQAVPRFKKLAEQWNAAGDPRRVVLLQLPPHEQTVDRSSEAGEAERVWLEGTVSEEKRWSVAAPVEILLSDGVVVSARGRAEQPSIGIGNAPVGSK